MRIETGAILGGKYRLVTRLAEGGMGSVWRAVHVELDTPVAIKCISGDIPMHGEALARFKQEARSAAQLRSPHVVQLLDYGVEGDTPYIAMELLSGTDLSTLLDADGRLGFRRMREILLPITKALTLAHDLRFVHRDIKPGNIFLARTGDDEVVKLVDFGIAKALNPVENVVNTTSHLVGSPIYMSPEQSRGKAVDHRTDLWSLGVVVFECLTGRVPFDGGAAGEVFANIITAPTPKPSDMGVNIPGLDAFVLRALEKDPDKRFQSARQLYEAFASLDDSSPTLAHVPLVPRAHETSLAVTPAPPAPPRGVALSSTVREKNDGSRIGLIALGAALTLGVLGGGYAYVRSQTKVSTSEESATPTTPVAIDEPTPEPSTTGTPAARTTANVEPLASATTEPTTTPAVPSAPTSVVGRPVGVRTPTRSSAPSAPANPSTDPLFGVQTSPTEQKKR